MIKTILTIAAITLFTTGVWAQKGKVIIIDTVSGEPRQRSTGDELNDENEQYGFSRQPLADICDDDFFFAAIHHFDTAIYPTTVYTKLGAVITNIVHDNVCLRLDNKGGMLHLKDIGCYHADTIRISNWTVYDNGIDDSTNTCMYEYPVFNDSVDWDKETVNCSSTAERYKGGLKKLSSISITLDGRLTIIPVTIGSSSILKSSTGYRPLKARQKYKQHTAKHDPPTRVFKYTLMEGRSVKSVRYFDAVLNL
jgi:hypothetical protein